MPNDDKTFSGSFVLDLRISWRQAHTLYRQGKKVIIWLTFKLGLALTGFRTILPCFQQVNLTWAHDPIENQYLVSGQLENNTQPWWALSEPAIWSRDTGQRISWYDSFLVNIIWTPNIKHICCNSRLHDLVLAGWPPCCATSSSLCARSSDPCRWPCWP